MSGTYVLDGQLFPKNPLTKRWLRQPVASTGVGEPLFSPFWTLEMNFGALETQAEAGFFETRWFAGGLHTAVLPHPETGQLVGFTGVAIQDFSYEMTDVERDYWADGGLLVLGHISLSATGT